MFKKILKILLILVFGVFVIFTLAFTSLEVSDVKCEKVEVLFDGQQLISLGKEEIVNIVKSTVDSIYNKNIRNINSEHIELEIEKNKTIQNAEVFKSVVGKGNKYKGTLTVKVKFREPVLRIMSGNENYFLDYNRTQIPVSLKYTANVLVATGDIESEFAQTQLLDFVGYLNQDHFLKAQIKQIHVLRNQELILTPLVGNHLIELGTLDNYQEKLAHLKVFYENVLAQNNWNKYKRINLKYNNQVIGTKK
ncbi:MAG: hypothetical protein HQ541_02820 [Mariniphaga sp.]|nr:hypothetical protein [Mariniphaga sp.]